MYVSTLKKTDKRTTTYRPVPFRSIYIIWWSLGVERLNWSWLTRYMQDARDRPTYQSRGCACQQSKGGFFIVASLDLLVCTVADRACSDHRLRIWRRGFHFQMACCAAEHCSAAAPLAAATCSFATKGFLQFLPFNAVLQVKCRCFA